jgi:hypothetical protein
MLKKSLVILVTVLIILAIIGLLLPRNIHVERSVTIARPESLASPGRRMLASRPRQSATHIHSASVR